MLDGTSHGSWQPFATPAVAGWTMFSIFAAARSHPLPTALVFALIFFMNLEYSLVMVKPGSEPWDLGFSWTTKIHDFLMRHSAWNSALAAANTAFVVFQAGYVIWTLIVEGRKRPTIAALFMYTCRGILGYATQLPLPQEFLRSGLDFPVGHASFFLFFSGHAAGSAIISLDMRRKKRWHLATCVDILNVLQCIRLLATRGHYSIDLVVGAGAGYLFHFLAGSYLEMKRKNEKMEGYEGAEREFLIPDV